MKFKKRILFIPLVLLSILNIIAQNSQELQQLFNNQIKEVNQLAKTGKLKEAIAKGENAKTFAFENFKDTYQNQIFILTKLNIYYKYLNDYENELATNIALYNIRNKDLKNEQKIFANSFKALAAYYASMDNPRNIIPTFKEANERLIKQTEEAFQYRFEDERATFLQNNIQPYLDLFQSFAYSTNYKYQTFNHLLTNNVLVTKGALLNASKDILKKLESLDNEVISRKINEYRQEKDFVTYQLSLNEKDRATELITKQGRLVGLESELVLYYQKNFSQDYSLQRNWRRTQLKENEVSIEFSHFNYYNKKWTDSIIYVAHVFKKNSKTPIIIPLFEEAHLQNTLNNIPTNEVYATRGSKGKSLDNKSVENLYNLIIKPIEKHIEGNTTVYYSPDGILHQIAFAALSNSDGELLIENYNLIQINSATSIRRTPVEPNSETALIIGGIDYDYITEGKSKIENSNNSSFRGYKNNRGSGEIWPYLKGTRKEAESLKALFDSQGKKSDYLSDKAANESVLKHLSSKSPNILHIATHGFFFENSSNDLNNQKETNEYKSSENPLLRSGLLLAGANYAWQNGNNPYEREDGILSALEISNLDFSNTDLVVLSACETGLGDIKGNEGVYGLQRAFKMAGVNLLMMSLWEVPDIETSEFMTHFYTKWLSGQPIRIAFRNTQLIMSETYKDNPEKWAAFVLFE